MIERTAFLALLLAAAWGADTLRFRDGSSVTGTWLGGTATEVRFLVNNQAQSFPKSDITEVAFGAIGAPARVERPKIVIEPNLLGVVYLQDATERLLPLEAATARMIRNQGLYGPALWTWRVSGAHSPTRSREGEKLTFVVRLAYGVDPRKFELFTMESKRDYRQSASAPSGSRPTAIPLTFTTIGNGVYSMSPARYLGRGEYSISPRDSNESFCFGVD